MQKQKLVVITALTTAFLAFAILLIVHHSHQVQQEERMKEAVAFTAPIIAEDKALNRQVEERVARKRLKLSQRGIIGSEQKRLLSTEIAAAIAEKRRVEASDGRSQYDMDSR